MSLTRFLFTLIATTVFSLSALANPADAKQTIKVSSDSALFDKLAGKVVYSGNVKMQQGTLKIEADKLTINRNEQGLDKVIALGKPAKYEQILNDVDGKTHAYGETIIYDTPSQELTLLESAGLEKQGNVFAGDKIVYLIKEQRVKAESPQKDERIRMVIQPKKESNDSAQP